MATAIAPPETGARMYRRAETAFRRYAAVAARVVSDNRCRRRNGTCPSIRFDIQAVEGLGRSLVLLAQRVGRRAVRMQTGTDEPQISLGDEDFVLAGDSPQLSSRLCNP
jgi:hypothetical protein